MSQVRSSSILVHMQKGVSILCRVDHFANTLNTFGGCADLNLHRHKKTGRPPDCFPLSRWAEFIHFCANVISNSASLNYYPSIV